MSGGVFCAAADWGTSSLRLWLLDRDGAVVAESRGDDGILSVGTDGYSGVLTRHLEIVSAPAGIPVIVSGMAGARQGWREAPYVATPADLGSICGQAVTVPFDGADIRILPGVAQHDPGRPDVMRGEETQLMGLGLEDGTVCIPGTHSKWARLKDGRLTGFTTFMTGELFAVLGEHSILRHSVNGAGFDADTPAFRSGAGRALDGRQALPEMLFGVRARGLVAEDADDGGAYLSGLLIGSEVAAAARGLEPARDIVLLASGALASLYQAAMIQAGLTVRLHDADAAARAGLYRAAREIWG